MSEQDPAMAHGTPEETGATVSPAETEPSRNLTPEAQRALAEAEERRRQQAQNETRPAREVGGRQGPDPVRFGDWEKGGIASDF